MGYETEHVRFNNEDGVSIKGVSTFTKLLENTDFAKLYTILRKTPMTAPNLIDLAEVSKKTVYSYLSDLERAGLASKIVEDSQAGTYYAEDFEMTLELRDMEVTVTSELISIFARMDEYPVIERVGNEHGVVPLVLAYDLVQGHADGEVTMRQIAQLTGLSSGTTYDVVEALYEILDLVEEDHTSTTLTPDDVDGSDDLIEQLVDN